MGGQWRGGNGGRFFAVRGPYGLNDVGITACRVRIGGGGEVRRY